MSFDTLPVYEELENALDDLEIDPIVALEGLARLVGKDVAFAIEWSCGVVDPLYFHTYVEAHL